MENRITPQNITALEPGEVFVFGSNLEGIHGKGAAKTALQWGAIRKRGTGFAGQTYAIPTRMVEKYVSGRSKNIARFKSLTSAEIQMWVSRFIEEADKFSQKTFLVTEIGCGNAGYTPEQIAPMFKEAIYLDNVHLPESFWNILMPK
jgi:hypothetical protein